MSLEQYQALMNMGKDTERRRQHELAFKESEQALRASKQALKASEQALKASKLALIEKKPELEIARKESNEAITIQQASNPTPAAPDAPFSSLNSLVSKWTEEESEAWLEEIKALFDNYLTTETERALVFTKHMEGKAKTALRLLERSPRGDMTEVRRVITKAYEITPEKWRQWFRGLAKEVGWSWTEWTCHKTQSGTQWFDSLSCTTLEDLFNRTMLEDLFQCVPGSLAVYLSDKQPTHLWKPANGLPSKPTYTNCKKFGHAEADCQYKLGNNRQPTNNQQNSSPSMSAQPSPSTVTIGRSAHPKGSCQECGTPGHYTTGYPGCPKHMSSTKHINLICATSSMAVLPEISS
ncbi:uncharacterized protein [Macrobrachium rosenbergii]|uniref:uncharacterized protein n=1 Tax=Macrobrachium rosenbergii TaxID=79674 RepID=UPI0034D4384F